MFFLSDRGNLYLCLCVLAFICLKCLKPGLRGFKSGLRGLRLGLRSLKPGLKSLKPSLRGLKASLVSLITGLGASNLATVTCRKVSVDCGLCAVLAGL